MYKDCRSCSHAYNDGVIELCRKVDGAVNGDSVTPIGEWFGDAYDDGAVGGDWSIVADVDDDCPGWSSPHKCQKCEGTRRVSIVKHVFGSMFSVSSVACPSCADKETP